MGFRDKGAVARAPEPVPAYQTCHRHLQDWVREANLERILRILAKDLQGKLQLEECFSGRFLILGQNGSGPPTATLCLLATRFKQRIGL